MKVIYSCLLVLLLLVRDCTVEGNSGLSAVELYKIAISKVYNFEIPALVKDKEVLGNKGESSQLFRQVKSSIWFKVTKKNQNQSRDDHYFRFGVISKFGIHLAKIEVPMAVLDGVKDEQLGQKQANLPRALKIVFQSESPFTSFSHKPGDPTIFVGLRNNTILAFDLESGQKTLTIDRSKLVEFDPKYGQSEGNLLSIGQVLRTDLLIFTPSREKIVVFDYKQSKVIRQGLHTLNRIRHIALPLSTLESLSSQKTNLYLRSTKYGRKLVNQPLLVATGDTNFVNIVMDYTNLKILRYWALQTDYKQNRGIVSSICHFGAQPLSSLFLALAENGSKSLFIFSMIHKAVVLKQTPPRQVEQLIDSRVRGRVNWILDTDYAIISQGSLFGGKIITWVFRLTTSDGISTAVIVDEDESGFDFSTIQMGNYNINDAGVALQELQDEASSGIYRDTNLRYFAIGINGDALEVKPSPLPWSECQLEERIELSDLSDKMLVGRYRRCGKCVQNLRESSTDFDDLVGNKIPFAASCASITCKDSEIRLISQKDELKCQTKVLQRGSENSKHEEKTIFDNGCPQGYNLDNYGVCRFCPGNKNKAINRLMAGLLISDCLVFERKFELSDFYLFNPLLYTASQLMSTKILKATQEQSRSLSTSAFYLEMFSSTERKDWINYLEEFILKNRTDQNIPFCYWLGSTSQQSDQSYSLHASKGY